MRRILTALTIATASLVPASLAPSSASAAGPDVPPPLKAKLLADGGSEVAADCEGFCVFSERGWSSPGESGYIHSDCFPGIISGLNGILGSLEDTLAAQGSNYSLASVLNSSSVINRCGFPVRLLRKDGSGVTISPGRWVWDLGAAPFRINDAVSRLG